MIVWIALLVFFSPALHARAEPPAEATPALERAGTLLAGEALPGVPGGPRSQLVTADEARTVATNWIAQILHCYGRWGDATAAEVVEVRELKLGERLLGYICRVQPQGFVVVSLRRELEPVKAYSESCGLDPQAQEGLADVIKGGMERILDAVEQTAGPVTSAPAEEVQRLLQFDYSPAWERLELPVDAFRRGLASASEVLDDCQAGGVMVTSTWDQDEPYNEHCPEMRCWEQNHNGRARVGCMATAAAQIMRYWCWPPYGVDSPYSDSYDWPNMPDSFTSPPAPPWQQIAAVAELCYEVGLAAGMDYGCTESGAPLGAAPGKDVLDGYEDHFRYDSGAEIIARGNACPADVWFAFIRADLERNRPIQYRIEGSSFLPLASGHSMVVDGWRISGGHQQYHVNYGWGQSVMCDSHYCNCWYTVDSLYASETRAYEMMLLGVRPINALGTRLADGWYSRPSFPYRYFDGNATGDDAHFDAGQYLQFLSGVKLVCTGSKIGFRGWSTGNTYLYTQAPGARGVRIHSGHIYLFKGGGIRLY